MNKGAIFTSISTTISTAAACAVDGGTGNDGNRQGYATLTLHSKSGVRSKANSGGCVAENCMHAPPITVIPNFEQTTIENLYGKQTT